MGSTGSTIGKENYFVSPQKQFPKRSDENPGVAMDSSVLCIEPLEGNFAADGQKTPDGIEGVMLSNHTIMEF
jgi:hypothetical protein